MPSYHPALSLGIYGMFDQKSWSKYKMLEWRAKISANMLTGIPLFIN